MNIKIGLWPVWLKVLIYFTGLWIATVLGGRLPPELNNILYYLLVSFMLSWCMLRAEQKSIDTLGFFPKNGKDWKHLAAGIAFGGLLLMIVAFMTLLITGDKLVWQCRVNIINLLMLALFTLASAFAQEFAFRGYPFRQLLGKYPVWLSQLLIAIPFGLMHVKWGMQFSEVALVMLTTGIGSVLFGIACLKTGRLLLPVGIHMGWNYFQVLLPRVEEQNSTGLFRIVTAGNAHQHVIVLLTYIVVMFIAIILMSKRRFSPSSNMAV